MRAAFPRSRHPEDRSTNHAQSRIPSFIVTPKILTDSEREAIYKEVG
jgi:hypothetical protein